jgi:hypothetical protein
LLPNIICENPKCLENLNVQVASIPRPVQFILTDTLQQSLPNDCASYQSPSMMVNQILK